MAENVVFMSTSWALGAGKASSLKATALGCSNMTAVRFM